MKMGYVKYEQKDLIGIVTIDREKALNALNDEVLSDLEAVIDAIDPNQTRCVIITGAGQKSFVAGADIAAMSTMTKEQGRAFSKRGNDVFRKIENLPVPVIAVVNGFALGGGCELSLSCDIRIASENALFGQPEAGLGITPGFGGTQRLARTIGVAKAKELIYTCRKVKADEALQIGLVNAVYPADQLMDECMKLAEKIARNAPIAIRQCKKAINMGLQMDIDSAVALEAELFGFCLDTKDQKNAMTAFCEKRKPDPFVNE
jgi:enoyl-CoA hydratase